MKTFRMVLTNYLYIIKKMIKSDFKLLGICVIMIIVGLVIPLSNVFFPKLVIWAVIQDNTSGVLLIAIILVFFVITGICNGIQNYFIRRNNFYLSNFGYKLHEDIQEISMVMPFPMIEDPHTLNRIKMAEACISQTKTIVETFCRCISATVLLTGYAVMIARLNLMVLLVFVVCVILNILVMKQAAKYEIENREMRADIERKKGYLFLTMHDYRFGKELRLFNLVDILTSKFNKQKTDKYMLNTAIEKQMTISNGIEGGLSFICELTIYLFLLFVFFNQGLAVDDFILYTGMAASFHLIAKGLIGDLAILFSLNASISDYREFVVSNTKFIDRKEEIERQKGAEKNCHEIVFQNVFFRYPGAEQDVLKGLNFTIQSGTHVSIVGINGAGKSTIVKLICRLYQPDSGKILLNNKDIWDYTMQEYMEKIAAVFQESKLFACSIAENICFQKTIDKQRMWKALRMVGMEEKIRGLKNQENSNALKYLYDDGVEFSGGEVQRLCIARAVYKQSDILLLDEPTAALDALAEQSIYESFSQLSKDKTTVFISHRLNSNRFCDKVLYLENGQIISQGTHDELMQKCESYHSLFMMQAQYYQNREGSIS